MGEALQGRQSLDWISRQCLLVFLLLLLSCTLGFAQETGLPPLRGEGDRRLGNGAVMDSSCLREIPAKRFSEFVTGVERALALAEAQAGRCQQMYGLGEVGSVPRILRRLRIGCAPSGPSPLSTMAVRTFHREGLWDERSAVFSGEFRLTIAVRPLANFWRSSVTQRASDFFHEALHFLPVNNRVWHNLAYQEHGFPGVCEDSIHLDRVYFTTAVCFPESEVGSFYYSIGGARLGTLRGLRPTVECPGVCERALREVDSVEASLPLWHGDIRMYVAQPYTPGDAEHVCRRIESVSRAQQRYHLFRVRLLEHWGQMVRQVGPVTELSLQVASLGLWLAPEISFPGRTQEELRQLLSEDRARWEMRFQSESNWRTQSNLIALIRGYLSRVEVSFAMLTPDEWAFLFPEGR